MGGIKIEHFDKEIIKRTQNLIAQYKGIYSITLLINCVLILIVLPHEFYKRKSFKFFNDNIFRFKELDNLIDGIKVFDPTKRTKGVFVDEEKTLTVFLRKLRNGIAHQQIEPISDDQDRWIKVTIRDFNKYNNDHLELEVTWSIRQFKKFALFISQAYLDGL